MTTIAGAFQTLKSNLEITGLQKSTIATSQNSVRKAAERGLTVLDSFVTGSYARSTMIAPLKEADVDIFIVLDSSYYEVNGQTKILDSLKNVLKQTYPSTPKISKNGQAVTITFTDFVVDVVPAFFRRGGGYLIADTNSKQWINTNPKIHVEYVSKHNTVHNSDLIPLLKMIKGWNKQTGEIFVSFYLELMAIQILHEKKISDFSSGVRYIFDKGRERIKFKATDPAGYGNQVNGLNSGSVSEAVAQFTLAHNRAIKAERYASIGDIANAISEWRKIFGSYFPA